MLYHAYQFAIQKYEILRINEIIPWQKREGIYCQIGDGKVGEQITADNATEVWQGLEIEIY